nr:MAG TPA: hypothetical protein [Caudoviricetes sp.]
MNGEPLSHPVWAPKKPSIIYADILFSGGIRTILFKCRQKKNLTRFISRVLELAQKNPSNIHPDLRS